MRGVVKVKGKILIIDDDELLREALASYLEGEGYEVDTASSVSEALASLETFEPHIALLDLLLNGDDGLDFLKVVAQERIPCDVVILTGYGSLETAVEAMRLGCRDYLLKPVDRSELLSRLEMILEERSFKEGEGMVVPVCCVCGKVRDEDNRWIELAQYMMLRLGVLLSHTYCPDCFREEMERLSSGGSSHEEGGGLPDKG